MKDGIVIEATVTSSESAGPPLTCDYVQIVSKIVNRNHHDRTYEAADSHMFDMAHCRTPNQQLCGQMCMSTMGEIGSQHGAKVNSVGFVIFCLADTYRSAKQAHEEHACRSRMS